MKKKEKKEKNKEFSLLYDCTAGYRRFLAFALVCVVVMLMANFITPMITAFTVDYVLRGDTSEVNRTLLALSQRLGDRQYFLDRLWLIGLLMIAISVVSGFARFFNTRNMAKASEGTAKTMRDWLFSHIEELPYDYHKHSMTGDLVQRCTSDVETVRRFLYNQLMELVRSILMVCFALTVMLLINRKLALLSVVVLPVLFVFSFAYFKRIITCFTESDEAEGKLSETVNENVSGVRVVRAFGQQLMESEKFDRCNVRYRNVTARLNKLLGLYWGLSDFLGYLQIGITMVTGIIMAVSGEISLGTVILFSTYVNYLIWPLRNLGRVLSDLGKSKVSLGRLREILDSPVEHEPGRALEPEIRGAVDFRNVSFGYDYPDKVLKGITFHVDPGQTVGILGSTGSGKSSLVHLMQRLYEVTGGEILIDGVNVNDIERHHLRRNIGIVMQEPFLYSRTIAENIRFGRPGATDEEMYECTRAASIHDTILGFDDGYDTIVGERGVTLSGGEKQRVAIARMLLQNAPILIFDDSMSAVDAETDAAIRAALSRRRSGVTTFIISHRITTLSESDFIIVLEGGRLTQLGTHAELLGREGLYRRIAEIQSAAVERVGE